MLPSLSPFQRKLALYVAGGVLVGLTAAFPSCSAVFTAIAFAIHSPFAKQ